MEPNRRDFHVGALGFAVGCLLLLVIPRPVTAQSHPTDRQLDDYERLLESLRTDYEPMAMFGAESLPPPGSPERSRDTLGSDRDDTPRVIIPDVPQVRPRPRLSPDSNLPFDHTGDTDERDRTPRSHGGSIVYNTYTFPFSAVVKLHQTDLDGKKWICSASVISEFHLLTAAHCIYQYRRGYYDHEKVYGFPAQTEVVGPDDWPDHPFGRVQAVKIRAFDPAEALTSTKDVNPSYDQALITLDRPIGRVTGGFGQGDDEYAASWSSHNMAGYPGDTHTGIFMYRKFAPSIAIDCIINCGTLWLQTQGEPGHSGGPLWVYENGGNRVQTAIHSARDGISSLGALLWDSAFVRDPWNWLEGWLAYDKANMQPELKPELIEDVTNSNRKDLLANTTTAGGAITVNWNAYNVGFAHTGRVTIRFYLSRDRSIRSNDTLIGTVSVDNGLNANSLLFRQDTFSIPANQAAGTYHVGYTMGGTVSEYTLEDNVVLIDERLVVTAAEIPDLIVHSATVSHDSLTAGQSFTFRAIVHNQGTGQAQRTNFNYIRVTPGPSNMLEARGQVGPLAPRASSTQSMTLTAPQSPGTYEYYACAVPTDDEVNRGNNCSDGRPITVTTDDNAPDLIANRLWFSGENFVLDPVLHAGPGVLFARLRHEPGYGGVPGDPDALLPLPRFVDLAIRYLVGLLFRGQSHPHNVGDYGLLLKTNAPATPGTYYYGGCVDVPPGGESNENNNCSVGRPITVTTDDNPDRAALVALYNATEGPNWTTNTNWNNPSAPLDQWRGVTIDGDGRVTVLDLGRNQLTGSIPDEIGSLTKLSILLLHDNQLSGSIPSTVQGLINLEYMHVHRNQLAGAIPSHLGNLPRLKDLSLGFNQFSGNIPRQLGDLGSLQSLGLLNNQLSGTIPAELGNLTNLEELYLADNRLSGGMPASFGRLTNMRFMLLNGNRLSGPIPVELGNITSSVQVRLDSDTGLCLPPDFPLDTPFGRAVQQRIPVCGGGGGAFTDDPVLAGVTPVRAVHFTELRGRIDALRTAHGLGRFPWTDPSLAAGVTPVRGVHMSELRTALGQVYDAASRTIGFGTEPVQAGWEIRAAHINELRRAVEALVTVAGLMITSNGGGERATITVPENQTAVTTVTASGGTPPYEFQWSSSQTAPDGRQFTMNTATGALAFVTAPDYENPTDSDRDNNYVLDVRVQDASQPSQLDTQVITVTVTR